jgi:hypothetical protein
MTEIHSCSYYCERPECIKAQRDELRERLAQPEKEPEKTTDADRLDWLQKAANARKVELARSIYKTGYEIGEWPSMRVTVKYGSLRQAIDEAMQRETNT